MKNSFKQQLPQHTTTKQGTCHIDRIILYSLISSHAYNATVFDFQAIETMRERGMENDPRYQQMLTIARMNGLNFGNGMPGMANNSMAANSMSMKFYSIIFLLLVSFMFIFLFLLSV